MLKNINVRLPDHTIVIKASNLKLQIDKTRKYRDMSDFQQYCLLQTVASAADIVASGTKSSKRIYPMLKFYVGRPVIINDNIDVENQKKMEPCVLSSISN